MTMVMPSSPVRRRLEEGKRKEEDEDKTAAEKTKTTDGTERSVFEATISVGGFVYQTIFF